jgi:hypothetical protein
MLFPNLHTPKLCGALPWIKSRKMLKLPAYVTSDKIKDVSRCETFSYVDGSCNLMRSLFPHLWHARTNYNEQVTTS